MARREQSPGGQREDQPQTLEQGAYVHTLSLRLTAQQYRRLRRFVTEH